jgi:hypothetical protein
VEAWRATLLEPDYEGTACLTLPLTAEDHPLVALAHRLGYRVEVTMSAPTVRQEPPATISCVRTRRSRRVKRSWMRWQAFLTGRHSPRRRSDKSTRPARKGEPLSLQNEAKPSEMASGACSGDSKRGEPFSRENQEGGLHGRSRNRLDRWGTTPR